MCGPPWECGWCDKFECVKCVSYCVIVKLCVMCEYVAPCDTRRSVGQCVMCVWVVVVALLRWQCVTLSGAVSVGDPVWACGFARLTCATPYEGGDRLSVWMWIMFVVLYVTDIVTNYWYIENGVDLQLAHSALTENNCKHLARSWKNSEIENSSKNHRHHFKSQKLVLRKYLKKEKADP